MSNDYRSTRNRIIKPIMTLIMGARCADGTMLVADRKMSSGVGSDVEYANKVTGEIKGALTAFSGDRGTFELFRNRLRNYVKTLEDQRKERRDKRNRDKFRGDVNKVLWQIHEIKNDLLRYNLDVMVALSSMYFRDKKSILYFFYHDGGYIPVEQFRAIGSGEPFGSYYLKRYWQKTSSWKNSPNWETS